VDRLRALDVEAGLEAGEVRVAGLTLGALTARLTARDGRLLLENRVGAFYAGRLAGRVRLAADQEPPELVLVQEGEGIQAGPLLADITGEASVTGKARFAADLRAAGQTPRALERTLSGTLSVDFGQGVIKGFNLEQMIRRAEARLKGRPAPAAGADQTDFTELSASAVIDKGVLSNEDLRATSDYIHASGRGRVDLPQRRLDYLLQPRFVKPPKGRGIKEIEDIPIPVRITGPLADPDWAVDLGPVLEQVARRRLERELDKEGGGALRELEERTGIKGLEQGLRSLFGR
jgi:AsmA protein